MFSSCFPQQPDSHPNQQACWFPEPSSLAVSCPPAGFTEGIVPPAGFAKGIALPPINAEGINPPFPVSTRDVASPRPNSTEDIIIAPPPPNAAKDAAIVPAVLDTTPGSLV